MKEKHKYERIGSPKDWERDASASVDRMRAILAEFGPQLVEHEIKIALGEARDDEGKAPEFGVQAAAAKALRQQILGNPLQRIEQRTHATKITAHFDLPDDPVGHIETVALPPPSQLSLPKETRALPEVIPVKATAKELIQRQMVPSDKIGQDATEVGVKNWQNALNPDYVPPVYPDEDLTVFPKKP